MTRRPVPAHARAIAPGRALLRRLAAARPRTGLRLGVAGSILGIGLATLAAFPLDGWGDLAGGIAFWSWLFGLSGAARILLLAARGRGAGLPMLRMLCAVIGLVSWSELVWLPLERATAAGGALSGVVGVYGVVALTQLQSIYGAARDARTDAS